MATDICLAVDKYSHAIGTRASDGTVPWTHILASNLFVVVKGINTEFVDGKLTMQIIQGTKVLESIDLAEYIDHAISTRRTIKQTGAEWQWEQLPIFAITKESLLAIRYRLSDGQSRRIQLRMQNPTECRRIVDCLMRRGMVFQEQRPRTMQTENGRPMTSSSQFRPLTTQTPSPYFDSGRSTAKPSPFTQSQVLEAGSLSRQYVSAERSPTRGDTRLQRTESPVHEMAPPTFFSRDVVSVPRDVVPERPTTSQFYRSYTTPSQQSQSDATDMVYQSPTHHAERPSSTSRTADLEAVRDAAELHESATHDTLALPQSHQAPHSNGSWTSSVTARTNTAILSSDLPEPRLQTARPSTALTMPFPDTLEHEIPPQRELPLRPESWNNPKDQTNSRPASALELPPLPKPTLTSENAISTMRSAGTSPTKAAPPSRPATASPRKRVFGPSDEGFVRPGSAAAVVDQNTPREPSPKRHASPQTAKPKSLNELLYGPKPLGDRSPNAKVPRLSSLVDAPHEVVSPPATSRKSPDRAANGSGYDPTIRPYAAITSPTRDANAAALEGYAAQGSALERQAALEEFFVANWENEEFIALCEDVENCWRRIALGL